MPPLLSPMDLMRLVWVGKLELNKEKAFCFSSDWMAKDLDSRKQLCECYKPTGNQDQECDQQSQHDAPSQQGKLH